MSGKRHSIYVILPVGHAQAVGLTFATAVEQAASDDEGPTCQLITVVTGRRTECLSTSPPTVAAAPLKMGPKTESRGA